MPIANSGFKTQARSMWGNSPVSHAHGRYTKCPLTKCQPAIAFQPASTMLNVRGRASTRLQCARLHKYKLPAASQVLAPRRWSRHHASADAWQVLRHVLQAHSCGLLLAAMRPTGAAAASLRSCCMCHDGCRRHGRIGTCMYRKGLQRSKMPSACCTQARCHVAQWR
jgi:hypothetical protein